MNEQLYDALAQARNAFTPIQQTGRNIDGPYTRIDDVVRATSSALAEFGLALMQYTEFEDDRLVLVTLLGHSSGQAMESRIPLVRAELDMEFGRHYDFHRCAQMQSVLGISGPDLSDNGRQQYEDKIVERENSPHTTDQSDKNWVTITKEQYDDLLETLDGHPQIARDIMSKYGIHTLRDMPKKGFAQDMEYIRRLLNRIENNN